MKHILTFSLLLLAIACRKKESPVHSPPVAAATAAYTIKDYLPLKYGNYWVYELTVTDSSNTITASTIDSCYVADSVYKNNKWFYRIVGNGPYFSNYQADSANYMISNTGSKVLSLVHNDTLLVASETFTTNNQWYNAYSIMKTIPATSFTHNSKTYLNCISRNYYVYSNMSYSCPNVTFIDLFSPGVGLVYCKYFFSNDMCRVFEEKLLRYKVN